MKIMNLQATFEARKAQKAAYENIQNICEQANKEVEAFVKVQLDGFIMNKFNLTEPDEAFQYYEFVSKVSGEDKDEYFLKVLEEEVYLFRIIKKSVKEGKEVKVSYFYEV